MLAKLYRRLGWEQESLSLRWPGHFANHHNPRPNCTSANVRFAPKADIGALTVDSAQGVPRQEDPIIANFMIAANHCSQARLAKAAAPQHHAGD